MIGLEEPTPDSAPRGIFGFCGCFPAYYSYVCAPFGGRTNAFSVAEVASKLSSLLAIYFAKVLKILKAVVRNIRNQGL
jgi:hypothetical protein